MKIALVKKLLTKNFLKPQIDALLRFLKLYVRFESKKLIIKFDDELDIITNRSNTMGLKEYVLNRERRLGEKKGIEKGIGQGIEQGMSIKEKEDKTNFTKSLLLQTDFSDEKIASIVGVDVEYVKEIRTSL